MKNSFPHNFDFRVLDSAEFKEDSVREIIIAPILQEIGYSESGKNKVIRSKALDHPFTVIGSRSHRCKIIPDYLLQVQDRSVWVLDAKAPTEKIDGGKNREQVYSYAIHPDVRVKTYALCNGREFIVFSVEEKEHILSFQLQKIQENWGKLKWLLSPQAFTTSEKESVKSTEPDPQSQLTDFDYTVEKEIGLLWSNWANDSVYSEIIKFKGQLLAEDCLQTISVSTWYELYRLQNGRFVIFAQYNEKGNRGGAYLAGANAFGEVDTPLTIERLQDEFPTLAKKAGLTRVREFTIE